MSSNHLFPKTEKSAIRPWFGWIALLLFGASFSCALARSYCLYDTDCPPGLVCVVAQCLRPSTEAAPSDATVESEPSESTLEPTPTEPLPEGQTCWSGETRPCDLTGVTGCVAKPNNTFLCSSDTCQTGSQRCVNGQWEETCSTSSPRGTEICDGIDNNCDGKIDDNLPKCLSTFQSTSVSGQYVGLSVDPFDKNAYWFYREGPNEGFRLRRIATDTQETTDLALVLRGSSTPQSFPDVVASALYAPADKSPHLLYFVAEGGCALYKATLDQTVEVERLGKSSCRTEAVVPYPSGTKIEDVAFKDILTVAVHRTSKKLYLLESSEQVIHEYDPEAGTILTIFAQNGGTTSCSPSPFTAPKALHIPYLQAPQLLLLFQNPQQTGILHLDLFNVPCSSASYLLDGATGLREASTFASIQDSENTAIKGYYFAQTAANNTSCSLYTSVVNAATPSVPSAPTALVTGACERKDGLLDGVANTASVARIKEMVWDAKNKRAYLLESSSLGEAFRRYIP
ncbi:MAG: putative metal-binding motif-containing protein [Myxococcales bacterium]|nr:putative metal-binding motif-containing protein [Myxococcales bacterium]